tara:strand:+ start:421 stop:588 length:168 start_codon:yes stop_codon:yes gene_type:complete
MDVYVGMRNEAHEENKTQAKWHEFLRNEEEALNLKKPITSCYEKDARELLEELPF